MKISLKLNNCNLSLKANKKFPYKLESKTCSQENIKHRHRRKEA